MTAQDSEPLTSEALLPGAHLLINIHWSESLCNAPLAYVNTIIVFYKGKPLFICMFLKNAGFFSNLIAT